jgi:hypothetical protein
MLNHFENFMSPLQRVRCTLGVLGLILAVPALAFAQSGYVTNGVEYPPAGILPGEQTHPDVSLTSLGGLLVWQDNITDGDGYGISAQLLDATFSPTFGIIHINQLTAGDQEQPRAAILGNGGKMVVWQGGKQGFQHIYARFLTSSNTFIGNDVMINSVTNKYQVNPAVAALADGYAAVVWGSFGQDNADGLQGVYLQIVSPTGQAQLAGGDAQVNQYTAFNQRSPAVAAFSNGNFIVTWISEQQRFSATVGADGTLASGYNSVDVYARQFNSNGVPLGNEFLVNTSTNICANPAVATASDGSYIITWAQKDLLNKNNSWDVFARSFNGITGGTAQYVNTQLYGDQYAPKISSLGTQYLVVWTSMGQDGSREGVFGQFLNPDASHAGGEFRVNTTILNQQIQPVVASDGVGRFLAVWSSYTDVTNSMDLMAQRYITTNQPLSAPAAPVVSALNSYTLNVAWAPLSGFSVDHWNLYVDNSSTPFTTTNTFWQNEGIGSFTNYYNPGSQHTFQLAYVLTDGRMSPLSAVASGSTWGPDLNNDGLPDAWETSYWGANPANWHPASYQLAPGVTVLQVFLQGANPNVPSTWLVQSIKTTPQGLFLSWNTQPGLLYQVQTASPNLGTWTNVGPPRFAAGTTDSIYLGYSAQAYYRIMRMIY